MRNCSTTAVHGSFDVDIEDLVNDRIGNFMEHSRNVDSGIVNQYVNLSVKVNASIDKRIYLLGVTHIGSECFGSTPA